MSKLNYEKKDLNIANSEHRIKIGLISRMITNAIFLSHKLRQEVLIRIFVTRPIPHIYQIESSTIRYLGPEMRSSASLFLKAERYVNDNMINEKDTDSLKWHVPNPGLYLRFSDNLFADLKITKQNSIMMFSERNDNSASNSESISLGDLEKVIQSITKDPFTFLFNIDVDLAENESFQNTIQNKLIAKFSLDGITFSSIINLLNLILDKIEEK